MLISFFGDVLVGRFGRADFVWRFLLLVGLFLAISFALGLTGGIAKRVALYIPISAALGFAALNVLAKRFRDLGTHGWAAVAGAAGLGAVLAALIPGPVEFFYAFAVIVTLAVVPGGALDRIPG